MSADPLDPIRAIRTILADTTEPPCNHMVWVDAYQQAINDISVHVYPEADQ